MNDNFAQGKEKFARLFVFIRYAKFLSGELPHSEDE